MYGIINLSVLGARIYLDVSIYMYIYQSIIGYVAYVGCWCIVLVEMPLTWFEECWPLPTESLPELP